MSEYASQNKDVSALKQRIAELEHEIEMLKLQKTEITAHEKLLVKSESQYRSIFENTGTAIVIIEENKIISLVNTEFTRLTGYHIDEIEGKLKWTFFIHKDDIDFMKEQHVLRRQNPSEAKSNYQFRLITKNGDIRHITLQIGIIEGTKQSIASLIDITDIKDIEKTLKQSESKYRLLIENQTDLIVKVDTKGKFLFVSPSYCKTFGKSSGELLGNSFLPLVHEEDRAHTEEQMKALFKPPYHVKIEQRALTVDGWRWFSWTDTAVLDENGEVSKIIGVGSDITAKKQAELKLRENERLLASMISNLPGYVYRCEFDDFWTIRFISPQCQEITGYNPEDFVNNKMKAYNDIILPEHREQVFNDWEYVVQNKSVYEGEYRIRTKQNQIKWMWERGIGVYNDNGDLLYLEGYVEDISHTKSLIEEITRSKNQAEDADRLKSAFLANMSHEIRTPMNGILGFIDLLGEKELTTKERSSYLELIGRSASRLQQTVDDIITISRLETGGIELFVRSFNLKEAVKAVIPEIEALSQNKNIIFSMLCDDNVLTNQMIQSDEEKVKSILRKILRNAVKYTDKGVVILSCSKQDDFFEFVISDTGIGIEKGREDAVFERFVQVDVEDVNAFQGVGLGMPIAKAYVEMLGGEIWFKSVEGKGTEFHFTLPVNVEDHVDVKNIHLISSTKTRELKILIVEDDDTSVKYLKVLLDDYIGEVHVVTSGDDAVSKMKDTEDYDVVFMDIKLPRMSGYEATRKIREFNSGVLIIAQTAYAVAGDREKALAAGCNDYITKPIAKDILIQMMQHYFG